MHFALLCLALTAAPEPKLEGSWLFDAKELLLFNADGTGLSGEMPFRWKVQGRKLLITSDRWGTQELIPFEFTDANTLVVTMKLFSSQKVSLTRAASGPRRWEREAKP